jgi:predicted small secreted protein
LKPQAGLIAHLSQLISFHQDTMSQKPMPQTNPVNSQPTRQLADSATNPSSRMSAWKELVEIPRWIVYCQAALLGIMATSFFVFGLMVGNLTSNQNSGLNQTLACRVTGSVVYRENGSLLSDEGAVVLLLPHDKKPDVRGSGESVSPQSFQALGNDAVDRIYQLGGAVVRADANGQFDVTIDAQRGADDNYYLLIVSKHKPAESTKMNKEQTASISPFFIPVEDVVDDRAFYWMKVTANDETLALPEFEF